MMTVFLLQTVLPLVPIFWLALLPPRSRAGFWMLALAAALMIFAAAKLGIWVFPPWWVPYLMALLLVGVLVLRLIRSPHPSPHRTWLPDGALEWLSLTVFVGIAGLAGAQSWAALAATQIPTAGQFLVRGDRVDRSEKIDRPARAK